MHPNMSPQFVLTASLHRLSGQNLAPPILSNEGAVERLRNQYPMKQIGSPEDLANVASFLLSSASSWISGQFIHVGRGKSTFN